MTSPILKDPYTNSTPRLYSKMSDANSTPQEKANMTVTNSVTEKKDKSAIFGVAAAAFLIWAIVMTALYVQEKEKSPESSPTMSATTSEAAVSFLTAKTTLEADNVCAGAKLQFDNIECMDVALGDASNVTVDPSVVAGPQAGANVTKGYNGDLEMNGVVPITKPYYQAGLCPVNVHWHLGAEHYSAGEYDCQFDHDDDHDDEHRNLAGHVNKCGPTDIDHRRELAGKVRQGFQCNLYDADDEKYTAPYDWKFCDASMEVGQTYEVHWPHSTVGACNTPNQYQTPFYDGVFCNLDMDSFLTLGAQDVASNVGVQAQVFVIVNDESYYYPDLIKGMIVEPKLDRGSDLAMYTGSSTGTTRDNDMCSPYSPITWHVDRKCHPISASSFDKMCADMMTQRDDMSDDLHAHGSRKLVADKLAANNHANLRV